MKRIGWIVILVFIVGLIAATTPAAQEQPGNPAYQWLNGKWEGPAPGGGRMELDLRVVNDNQIGGSGQVRGAGKGNGYRPHVVGSVAGDSVTLDLQNPNSGNNVKLDFVRTEGALKGARKGEEVVYRKLE
jgi:hypothetical protein